MAQLRIEICYDHEADLWGYSVPVLSIIGTGCLTREDAERFVLDAIEFAIEEEVDDPHEGADVITYDVRIAKAS